METIAVEKAVGMVLGHDLTRIIPGQCKEVAFKKGHIIRPEDIPALLRMGKDRIYVFELGPDELHENTAAAMLAGLVGGLGVSPSEPAEAKVNFRAAYSGLLTIDVATLNCINTLPGIAVATLHTHTAVRAGELVASVKIIPLVIPAKILQEAGDLCRQAGLVAVKPFLSCKVGLVVTGNEVYYGRIEDKFAPVIAEKLAAYPGCRLSRTLVVPDDAERIRAGIGELATEADMVLVSGGMSVDPDDATPEGIRRTGAAVEIYGTPVLPGAMFMLAYLDDKPVVGVPACGMYAKTTVLDVVLPRLLAGERVIRPDIAALGHGGLCRACKECRFPDCSFGK